MSAYWLIAYEALGYDDLMAVSLASKSHRGLLPQIQRLNLTQARQCNARLASLHPRVSVVFAEVVEGGGPLAKDAMAHRLIWAISGLPVQQLLFRNTALWDEWCEYEIDAMDHIMRCLVGALHSNVFPTLEWIQHCYYYCCDRQKCMCKDFITIFPIANVFHIVPMQKLCLSALEVTKVVLQRGGDVNAVLPNHRSTSFFHHIARHLRPTARGGANPRWVTSPEDVAEVLNFLRVHGQAVVTPDMKAQALRGTLHISCESAVGAAAYTHARALHDWVLENADVPKDQLSCFPVANARDPDTNDVMDSFPPSLLTMANLLPVPGYYPGGGAAALAFHTQIHWCGCCFCLCKLCALLYLLVIAGCVLGCVAFAIVYATWDESFKLELREDWNVVYKCMLPAMSFLGSRSAVEDLLASGIDPNFQCPVAGPGFSLSKRFQAIAKGDEEISWITPLSMAASGGHAGVITSLVAAGANPNAAVNTAKGKTTPLWNAIHSGRAEAVEALLIAGADPDSHSPNPLGFTPLQLYEFIRLFGLPELDGTAIHALAKVQLPFWRRWLLWMRMGNHLVKFWAILQNAESSANS